MCYFYSEQCLEFPCFPPGCIIISFLDLLIHAFCLSPQVLFWVPQSWCHFLLSVSQNTSRSARILLTCLTTTEHCKVTYKPSIQSDLTNTLDLEHKAYPLYQTCQLCPSNFNSTSHFHRLDEDWPQITSSVPISMSGRES